MHFAEDSFAQYPGSGRVTIGSNTVETNRTDALRNAALASLACCARFSRLTNRTELEDTCGAFAFCLSGQLRLSCPVFLQEKHRPSARNCSSSSFESLFLRSRFSGGFLSVCFRSGCALSGLVLDAFDSVVGFLFAESFFSPSPEFHGLDPAVREANRPHDRPGTLPRKDRSSFRACRYARSLRTA